MHRYLDGFLQATDMPMLGRKIFRPNVIFRFCPAIIFRFRSAVIFRFCLDVIFRFRSAVIF